MRCLLSLSLALLLGLGLTPRAAAQELVVNGGFETGDFTGWTQFGDTSATGVVDASFGFPPHSGTFYGAFGPISGIGGITQTVTTTAGQTYHLSYWLWNLGGTPSEFQLSWEGNTVVDNVNPPADADWVNVTMDLTATVSGSSLAFGFFNVPSFFLLDDVSVTAAGVPEPATWALIGLSSLAVTGGIYYRRRKQNRAEEHDFDLEAI